MSINIHCNKQLDKETPTGCSAEKHNSRKNFCVAHRTLSYYHQDKDVMAGFLLPVQMRVQKSK